jgi:uncharacterized OsmC-like protein
VSATGTYDGPRFTSIEITVESSLPEDQLTALLEPARRACYVSNTFEHCPPIVVSLA